MYQLSRDVLECSPIQLGPEGQAGGREEAQGGDGPLEPRTVVLQDRVKLMTPAAAALVHASFAVEGPDWMCSC